VGRNPWSAPKPPERAAAATIGYPTLTRADLRIRASRAVKQYSDVKELPRQQYAGAAGGQFIILPYPAANELSGIYATKFARDVDTREVQSRFDNSRPLVADSTSYA